LDLCLPREAGTGPSVILLAEEAEDLAEFGDLWKAAALEAGARGVLGRESMALDLVDAVKAVQGGQLWGPREVVALLRDRLVQSLEQTGPDEALGLARRYAYN
jgi:DNA-binding NarL/FixJ family response regulator